MSEPYDTIFSLPSIDEDPGTEIGVLLMGLGPERLLAGLGVAARGLAGDPATATLLVDQLRHGVRDDQTFETALADGAGRWRAAGAGFATADPLSGTRSAALRQRWTAAMETVTRRGDTSAAEQVYLAACWLRRAEIDRIAEEHSGGDPCPT